MAIHRASGRATVSGQGIAEPGGTAWTVDYGAGVSETQRRPVPRVDTGELDTALAFLDFARDSVMKKVDGLSEDQQRRPMVPSGTSLVRLIRHLTDGERFWFRVQLLGEGSEPDWDTAAHDHRHPAQILADYRDAISDSNAAIRQVGDVDAFAVRDLDGQRQTLRWTLAHMTSETARHAGHADIVRELIDGVTGR
jgi:uncharacterized damage-inducible protein DinB